MVKRYLVLSNTSMTSGPRQMVLDRTKHQRPFGVDQMSHACAKQNQMLCKEKDISWILYLGSSGVQQAPVMVKRSEIQEVVSWCQSYFSFSIFNYGLYILGQLPMWQAKWPLQALTCSSLATSKKKKKKRHFSL